MVKSWSTTQPSCIDGLREFETSHKWQREGTLDACSLCGARRRPPRKGERSPTFKLPQARWAYVGTLNPDDYIPNEWRNAKRYELRTTSGVLAEVRLCITTARPRRRP